MGYVTSEAEGVADEAKNRRRPSAVILCDVMQPMAPLPLWSSDTAILTHLMLWDGSFPSAGALEVFMLAKIS